MNPGLSRLQSYPFEKLAALLAGVSPAPEKSRIDLSIGEPQHPTPALIHRALIDALPTTARYPATRGGAELRGAIAEWLTTRYRLPPGSLDPDAHVLPLNGSREGLFAIAQCCIDRSAANPIVVMPNPCYQVYEGSAWLAGAEPYYIDLTPANHYRFDVAGVPETVWRRCQLLYLCSPHNPTGEVLDKAALGAVIELAARHGFAVVADECYAELYYDETRPPPGILQVAADLGRARFRACLSIHSLSKRSNAPGLRSGFIAGDPDLIAQFQRYRTYHGGAMPLHTQAASAAAWRDEAHVTRNRALYRAKFDATAPILRAVADVSVPPGGFYFWLRLPVDDQAFTRRLYEEENVKVVPGSYLARGAVGANPGRGHIRVALVPEIDQCIEAARRIAALLGRL
jgi:N-succinyldiaminopimelate aminotransferase